MDDEDLYARGEDDAPPSDNAAPDSPEGGEPMGEPVLVNKELCEDCQPGDRLIVEVLKDHGKELEIRYVGKEGGDDDMPPGEPPPEMAEAGAGGAGGGDSMMD